MNSKAKGEKGQRIVIGELAKWDIDVAIPLTDNLPYDLIVIYNGKLFKAQVKSSSKSSSKRCKGSIDFKLQTSNWYAGTTKKYSLQDCDVMILCDYQNIYLLSSSDFVDRRSFDIRKEVAKNGQSKYCNMYDDFVISEKRIAHVFWEELENHRVRSIDGDALVS